MKKSHLLVFTFCILCLFSKFAEGKQVEAKLVTEVESIQPGKPFWVGLHLQMKNGWSTYWKNPGDTGYPISIDWELPEGFQTSDIYWPIPNVFKTSDLTTFGYENETLLLVEITPPHELAEGQLVSIKGIAKWLACNDSCIPGEETLTIEMTVKTNQSQLDEKWKEKFDIVRNQIPQLLKDWKVEPYFYDNVYGLLIQALEGNGPEKTISDKTRFYPFNNDIEIGGNQYVLKIKGKAGKFLFLPLELDPPAKLEGILVNPEGWLGGGKAPAMLIDSTILNKEAIVASKEIMSGTDLMKTILFAFIGGLILNLMPCVFPILSLKVLGFLKHADESAWKAKMHGIAFAIGVILSFWVVSGLLLILRAGGEQLGWGFQLQSPLFITFLCFLLILMALNFAGVYEIGTSFISVGGRMKQSNGYGSSFSSGILATVLATPCTAPFMGTALGFALTQPALYSFLIFTGIAVGMAMPYLVLTFIPKLLKYLPKPGAWMETFKQAMAFPLIATVIWLLWVFSNQTDNNMLAKLLFGLLVAGLGVWVYGRFATFSASRRRKYIATTLSICILGAGLFLGFRPKKTAELQWEEYSAQRVEELRKEEKVIFIDFTAAWCLTCQVNKNNVFSSKEVLEAFKNRDIVLMKADYTNHDPAITKALESYGRSGVPTNVLYSSNKETKPIVLPELLTPSTILDVLHKM